VALKNLFKLEKLKINAYRNPKRTNAHYIDTFEAMYNPTSFKQKYEIIYGKKQGINSAGKKVNYSYSKPAKLKLKLILDGTGVDQMGITLLKSRKTVAERVSDFLELAYHMTGTIHQPNFLEVEWGDMKFWGDSKFPCRLGSVEVTYTSFNRDGTALRAELDVTLVSDEEVEKRQKKENKSSPDLTHSRIVKSGDTLPLLCQDIYGKPDYYLRVAEVNELDDFRNLKPGQELFFPPFES
jgi:hypothetical protein